VPYGNVASITYSEKFNHEVWLKNIELPSQIQIRFVDQFGAKLSLPSNAHPHIVFVLGELEYSM